MSEFRLPLLDLGGGNAPTSSKDFLSRFKLSQIATAPKCEICTRNLKNEKEFNQNVSICGECLNIYSRVESALNQHSEQQAIEARKQQFAARFGEVNK